jgi:MoaA/NifB/PqqE/SkfB family radical SAM enzyme
MSGPDVLGILLTAKCNISCRHCCNDSHPRNIGAVAFDDAARLIESAREIPSIREIGISGGEPFLFYELLCQVVEFAASLGFSSSVTTNGFWVRSPLALPRLETLRASGLKAIHISTSAFHQEFIDLATVCDAARIARDADLAVTINIVSSAALTPERIRLELGELCNSVSIVVMPCLPAGRGASAVSEVEFARALDVPHGNCREHFKKLAIDISGDVYPCCSPGGFTPPLRMGNVYAQSLRSIYHSAADSRLLAILESVGPSFFLPFLRAASPSPPLPERFSDQCHLCHEILSSRECSEIAFAAANQLFFELDRSFPGAHGDAAPSLLDLMRMSATDAH